MTTKKVKGVTLHKCRPYSCWMSRDGCSRLKKKAHLPKTRILFMHFNELKLCRDCEGIK